MNWPRQQLFILFSFSLLSFTVSAEAAPPSACIDSVQITVQNALCHGMRNGKIRIDSVYGGMAPYYFSLDGSTFSTYRAFDRLWMGEYQLWVRDAAGCEFTMHVLIDEPAPLIVDLLLSDSIVSAGNPFTLSIAAWPDSIPIASIVWSPSEYFANQNLTQQIVKLDQSATISVEVTSDLGCSASAQLDIDIKHINIFVPNAIHPPDGENAWLTVFAEEGLAQILRFQVFNRDGGLLFENKNFLPNQPSEGWNGRWRNRYVQAGVYTWIAILQYTDGRVEQRSGSVSVVR